jgi:hypothetical protein
MEERYMDDEKNIKILEVDTGKCADGGDHHHHSLCRL